MGVSPIPLADTLGLTAIYIAMFAGISTTYGLPFSEGFLATLLASVVGVPAAAMTGPIVVGSLLKFIPAVGSLVGGIITGGVAATLATTIGVAYVQVLHQMYVESAGEAPAPDKIIAEVKQHFQREKMPS